MRHRVPTACALVAAATALVFMTWSARPLTAQSAARPAGPTSRLAPERPDPVPTAGVGSAPVATTQVDPVAAADDGSGRDDAVLKAHRATVVRRLYLDLAGVAPTAEEVVAFVNDRSPDALEQLVNRLLAASPPAAGGSAGRLAVDAAVGFVENPVDAQQVAARWVAADQQHHEAMASLGQCQDCHQPQAAARLITRYGPAAAPEGPWIGISVAPADEVMRAQLKLPEGTGVIVTDVMPDSPAEEAGVERYDLILNVDGHPVAVGADLDRLLREAQPGGKPLTLKMLRGGQPVEKQVTPRQPGDFAELAVTTLSADQYRIGVTIAVPDEALRAQLRLGDAGLVVTGFIPDSAAAAQGVKANDVLLSANGRILKDAQDLTEIVSQSRGSPVQLALVRGAERLEVAVTPRKVEPAAGRSPRALSFDAGTGRLQELHLVQPGLVGGREHPVRLWDVATGRELTSSAPTPEQGRTPDERLEQMTEQLERLRQELEAVRADLKAQREQQGASGQKSQPR